MNILDLLLAQIARNPNQEAVVFSRVSISFQTLGWRAANLSELLRRRGIREGDKVLVLAPQDSILFETISALWSLGAVAVFVDPTVPRRHFEHALKTTQPKAVLGIPKAFLLSLFSRNFRAIPVKLFTKLLSNLEAELTPIPLEDNHPALITFTSGSTGLPKAIVRSHKFLHAQHTAVEKLIKSGTSRVCSTLPIVSLGVLASGGTVIIPAGSKAKHINAHSFHKLFSKTKPDTLVTTPTSLEKIYSIKKPPQFHRFFIGGSPVWPHLALDVMRKNPGCEFTTVYGSSEAEPISSQNWNEMKPADLSLMQSGAGLLVGSPVEDVQIQLLDVKKGVGEIAVTGDHVVKHNSPQALEDDLKLSGDATIWHRTGDAGYLDDTGRLWLLGRLVAGANRQYPLPIETSANFYPGVVRSAALLGERKLLFVQWKEKADLEGIRAHCARFGLDEIRSIDEIPLDARLGTKVDYPRLQSISQSNV